MKPDTRYGYTESHLRNEMEKRGCIWSNFLKWMNGQTVGLLNGETVYYTVDVKRYMTKGGMIAQVTD